MDTSNIEGTETIATATRVVIETFPNRLVRHFNVATAIGESPNSRFSFPVRADYYEFTNAGKLGSQLVMAIQDRVPGVEQVALGRYEVSVTINIAFDWETVEPAILAVIEAVVGPISVRLPISSDDIFVVGPLRVFFCDDSSDDGVDGSNTSDEVDADGTSDEVDDLN